MVDLGTSAAPPEKPLITSIFLGYLYIYMHIILYTIQWGYSVEAEYAYGPLSNLDVQPST